MDLFVRDASAADMSEAAVFKLYHYDPTVAGAVVFVFLFLATTILHFWQLIRSRCWFLIPLAVGGVLQVIGYAGRAKSGQEDPNWSLVYMELGRIITVLDGEGHCLIRKEWLTKLFVAGDVLSFFLQGGGGGYQASGTLEALEAGAKVIIVGLFVQLTCFGFFVVVAVAFHRAINNAPTGRSNSSIPWRKHMTALYVGSFLIMVRSVFRAAE
ncbi:hypothetical protein CcaCcLH18_14346 [Colletotrichum camelliae]|nr:hypothetical protein CcaCcLH18_14346 [Colletotrichum camelliae]